MKVYKYNVYYTSLTSALAVTKYLTKATYGTKGLPWLTLQEYGISSKQKAGDKKWGWHPRNPLPLAGLTSTTSPGSRHLETNPEPMGEISQIIHSKYETYYMVFLSSLLGVDPKSPLDAKTLALTKPYVVYLMTTRRGSMYRVSLLNMGE